jgi:hypothetical protein
MLYNILGDYNKKFCGKSTGKNASLGRKFCREVCGRILGI